MNSSNSIFIANVFIATIAMIAYAYNVFWLQVIFFLYLAFILHFASVIAIASLRFRSIEKFAALTIALDTDASVMIIPSKEIWTRFFTYDVPFAIMLIYLGEPGVSLLLLGGLVIIHLYCDQITRLSER